MGASKARRPRSRRGHRIVDPRGDPGRAVEDAGPTAAEVVAELTAARTAAELPEVRKRLAPGEEALGPRMGDVYSIAKESTDLPLVEVHRLLDHPAYEAWTAADRDLAVVAAGDPGSGALRTPLGRRVPAP